MRFVPANALKPGMLVGRDIVNAAHSFMLKKGVELTENYIEFLQTKGYLGAYVTDRESLMVDIEEPVSTETQIKSIEAVEKGDIEGIVASSTSIVSEVSQMSRISIDLIDLRSFDDYTYHHSVNVAVYSVAVGKQMGLSESNLRLLCQAGLCHDLGKARVPIEVLNKPGRLDDDEYALVKKHAQYSYDILYGNPEISAIVRQAVICHHENENGTGYPFGKESKDIPFFAKIIHAVDVFDALTSKRPYKDPYEPAKAYEYIKGGRGILFDEAVVDAMCHVIPAYPAGIDVCLSNGETALVVGHTSNMMRPKVRISATGEEVDLSVNPDYRDVFIAASGIVSLDYAKTVDSLNEKRNGERKKNIIIVDDSAISLHQAKAALPDIYNIVLLNSGTAAINYIKAKGAPDLLMIDVDMPVLNGIATVATLRRAGYVTLPVMFLTGVGDRETVLRCKSVGAIDYIMKPAKPTYLRERVAFALDKNLDR